MRNLLRNIVLILLAQAAGLEAQQGSPNVELLGRARAAFLRTEYSRADSIASRVLGIGNLASRRERVEAMQIDAAALFPEVANWRRPDSAVAVLRLLVRLEPDRGIPGDISWPGLDSLLEGVRSRTFGAIAHPDRDNTLAGVGSSVTMPVVATKPAWFRLVAIPQGSGTAIPLDSGGPARNAVLHFGVLDGDKVRLPSGVYHLRFTAIDSAVPDTIVIDYMARVDAPALSLVLIATSLDTSRLLPERTRPNHGRNVAIGVGLGATTVLLATLLRGENPVRSATSVGASGYVAAAGLALGAISWGLHDRGSPIPSNIEANARSREEFARAVRDAQAENDQRRVSYRATITIDPEPRQ